MADYKDGNLSLTGHRLSDFEVGLGMGALVNALAVNPNNFTIQDRAALLRIYAFLRRSREGNTLFVTSESPIFYIVTRLLLPSKWTLEVNTLKKIDRPLKRSPLVDDISQKFKLQTYADLRQLFPDFVSKSKHSRVIIFVNGEEGDVMEWAVRQGHLKPEQTLVIIRDYGLSKNPSAAPLLREIGGLIDERADGLGEYVP